MRRSGRSATEGAALIGVYSMLFYLPINAVLWQPSSKLFAVSRVELLFQGFYPGRLNGSGAAVFVEPRNRRTQGNAGQGVQLARSSARQYARRGNLSEVPLITEDAGIVAISRGVLLATGIMSLRSPGKAA